MECSIFDVLSLMEDCTTSAIHNQVRLKEYMAKAGEHPNDAEESIIEMLEAKIRDAKANYQELANVREAREAILEAAVTR